MAVLSNLLIVHTLQAQKKIPRQGPLFINVTTERQKENTRSIKSDIQ